MIFNERTVDYDKLIIGQSFFMEVIMKKGIIIAISYVY